MGTSETVAWISYQTDTGQLRTFTLVLPSDMLLSRFANGGLKDELGSNGCSR